MDFFNALDNGRYSKFKVDVENDRSHLKHSTTCSRAHLSSRYIASGARAGHGAAFATRADDSHHQEENGRDRERKKSGNSGQKSKSDRGSPLRIRRRAAATSRFKGERSPIQETSPESRAGSAINWPHVLPVPR